MFTLEPEVRLVWPGGRVVRGKTINRILRLGVDRVLYDPKAVWSGWMTAKE